MTAITPEVDGWFYIPDSEYVYECWFKLLPDPKRDVSLPLGGRAVCISKGSTDYAVMNKQEQLLYGRFPTLEEAKAAGQKIVDSEMSTAKS